MLEENRFSNKISSSVLVFLVFFVALFLSSFSSALNINDCATLDQSDTWYDLTANVSTTLNVCMNVTANNVTLDCNNHFINGTTLASNYGVFVNASHNFTLFNCTVSNWYYGVFVNASNGTNVSYSNLSYNSWAGVTLQNTENTSIQDNLFDYLETYGILVQSVLAANNWDNDDVFVKRNDFRADSAVSIIEFYFSNFVLNKNHTIIIEYNNFSGGAYQAIRFYANYSNATIRFNDFNGWYFPYGIVFQGQVNYPATVYNNTFRNFQPGWGAGLRVVNDFSFLNVSNNFFKDNDVYAIEAYYLTDSVFFDNHVEGGGISIDNGWNVTVDCNGNVMDGKYAMGSGFTGLLVYADNSTVKNCNINNSEYGILISANSTVFNNTIKNIDDVDFYWESFGVYVYWYGNNVSFNTIEKVSRDGLNDKGACIYVDYDVYENKIHDNSIKDCYHGIYEEGGGSSFNNEFYRNTINDSSVAVKLFLVLNESFHDNVINNSTISAFNLYSNAFNITSTNNVISSAPGAFDFAFGDFEFGGPTSGSSAIALNTSFNKSAVAFDAGDSYSNLTVAWFTDVRVVNATGDGIASAEVNITNVNGTSLLNASTNATGWIDRQVVTEYWQDNQTILNFTPHYFNASKTGFNSSSVVFPITADPTITIMLSQLGGDVNPPSVLLNSPGNGYASNETISTFSFTAIDDVSLVMNCSLFLNGSLNQTNSSTLNNTVTQFSVAWLPEGNTTWRVDCSDGAGNTGNSENRIIKIDRTPPFFFNITVDVMTSLANVFWVASELATSWVEYWTNGIQPTNSSANPFAIYHSRLLSALSPCTLYSFKIWGFDEVGNLGSSAVNTFTTQGCEGGGGGGGGGGVPSPSATPSPTLQPSVSPTLQPTVSPTLSIEPFQTSSRTNAVGSCFYQERVELELKRALTVFKVDSVFHTLVNLTVSNKGMVTVSDVRVTEQIPFELVSKARFLNSPSLVSSGNVTWLAGTLAPGESKSFAYLLPGRFEASDFKTPTVSGKTLLVSLNATVLFEFLLLLALLLVAVSSYLLARRKQTH